MTTEVQGKVEGTGRTLRNVLVTGGAGFIGGNFIRYLLAQPDFGGRIINYDKLTYAGNLQSLEDVKAAHGSGPRPRYAFERGDIADGARAREVLRTYAIDTVVHFAAESHVDRSISGPAEFIQTNVVGTFTLLEAVREFWGTGGASGGVVFHHVSTDEVFGSLGPRGAFTETTAYDPRSPYSASKAASDHLVRAYHHTYGLPVTMSNCSNNYGPYHFPEKLIPLMIARALAGESLPVYGDGKNVRDWLYVEDHASAIWTILRRGRTGESYNVGGANEWENLRLVHTVCELLAEMTNRPKDHYKKQIAFVADRPGHDRRYAIDGTKLRTELAWAPGVTFDEGLRRTVRWYLEHQPWVEAVTSGTYTKETCQ